MTPLWRRAVKQALASRDPDVRLCGEGIIQAFHCFDMTAVRTLMEATAAELASAGENDAPERSLDIDLGERVVFPADSFWLEWGSTGVLFMGWRREGFRGAAVMMVEERLDEVTRRQEPLWSARTIGLNQFVSVGHVVERGDGAFSVSTPGPGERRALGHGAAHERLILLTAFAALAVINSPAARATNDPPHRGLAKIVRQVAKGAPETRASLITLGDRAGTAEGPESASPRAYHFCRAHTRQRAGRIERVRAHWRGDPAFGIRIGHYRVRA